ncbi:MAG: hypothetical protein HN452_03355 [Thaumarchaeota archaeon]|jgi:hypothetical protein|nr:hypothetical protein [Nitrososphaerota archaeon]
MTENCQNKLEQLKLEKQEITSTISILEKKVRVLKQRLFGSLELDDTTVVDDDM